MRKQHIVMVSVGMLLLLAPFVFSVSNVEFDVDGTVVLMSYDGTPPFKINIRSDEKIGRDGGFVWATTDDTSFSYDFGDLMMPYSAFYFGVKDSQWSDTNVFCGSGGAFDGEECTELDCFTDADCFDNDETTEDSCVNNNCVYEAAGLDASIKMSTMKDFYALNELIELTDSPTYTTPLSARGVLSKTEIPSTNSFSKKMVSRENGVTSYVFKEEEKQAFSGESQGSQGYIVVFNTKPLITRANEINKISSFSDSRKSTALASYEMQVDSLQKSVSKTLVEKHGVPKETITQYKNSISAISLELAPDEVGDVKKLPGVKGVYPDVRVEASLMDSIGMINADEVWKLDADGNLCADSGKACLTGEGMTIGIIDTGVDYTHADLGGCFGDATEMMLEDIFYLEDSTGMVVSFEFTDVYESDNEIEFKTVESGDSFTFNYADNGNFNFIFSGITYEFKYDEGLNTLTLLFESPCKVIGGYDFVNDDADPMDDQGHGTHCAATAAGDGVLTGVAPDAKIYAYKVLDAYGSGYSSAIIAGIERSLDPNQDGDFSDMLDVISLSLGGWGNPDDPMSQAIDTVVDAGVIAVVAAGNSGPRDESIGSPGTARNAITVGAVDKENDIADFSSRGPVVWEDENGNINSLAKPDVVAPGVLICAAQHEDAFLDYGAEQCLDDEHVAISGTSMATPHVAGAAALLKQRNPDWTPNEIKYALIETANDIGEGLFVQGAGEIDVLQAVSMDNKPSILEIETSGFIGGVSVDIIGSVLGGATGASLYYSEGENLDLIPEERKYKICDITSQVDSGVLCNWDIREFGDFSEFILILESESSTGVSKVYSLVEVKNTLLSSPLDLWDYDSWRTPKDIQVILVPGKNIEIKGSATGFEFDHFSIEYCQLEGEYLCSTEGITLVGGGTTPISAGTLGYLSIPKSLKSGFYSLQLHNQYGQHSSTVTSRIYIETSMQDGWPKNFALDGGGGIFLAFEDQPTIVDINNDNKNDLVFSYGDSVSVVDGNGDILDGWPVRLETEGIVQFGSAVADLDNDGFNEIVVGDNQGYVHILNHDGTYLFETRDYGSVVGTPSIFDVDGDGNLDIIWCDWNSALRAIDANGDYLEGFPVWLHNPAAPYLSGSYHSVSVSDINNDGSTEIFVEISGYSKSNNRTEDDRESLIWGISSNGEVLDGWPKKIWDRGSVGSVNIVFANLDYDSDLEIVTLGAEGTVFVWNVDGSDVNGWPVRIPSPSVWYGSMAGPIVSDLDLDGDLEIVFTSYSSVYEQYYNDYYDNICLFAYDHLGNLLDELHKCGIYGDSDLTSVFGIPAVGNVDSDPEMEIVLYAGQMSQYNLPALVLLNHDGTIVEGFPKYVDEMAFGNQIPIGDLDGDGDNEIIFNTWRGTTFVYDLNGQAGQDEWPVFQHDSLHTGNYYYLRNGSMISPRELSYIVNHELFNLEGDLLMKLQKKESDSWDDKQVVTDEAVTILPESVFSLSSEWNPHEISVSEPGMYRILAQLNQDGDVIRGKKGPLQAEFEVKIT